MAGQKLLRPNVRIRAHYPEAFAVFSAPKAAELNDTAFGFNIGCATTDDYTLNQTASETDSAMSPCDATEVSTPTTPNYEVSLDFWRDTDRAATGLFNKAFDLFKVAGCPFVFSKSLGRAQNASYVVGDIVSLYGTVTLSPEEIMGDGEMLMLGARFRPTGDLLIEYKVAA